MEVPAPLGFSRVSNERSSDLPLEEHREALVEPEVLEVLVGDQVASPAVHDLVDYYVRLTPVACLQSIKTCLCILLLYVC